MYEAYAKRKVADELSNRRSLETAALWANTNLDTTENEGKRQEIGQSIDLGYSTAIAKLYGEIEEEEETQIDEDDPFFQAMERGMQKRSLPDPKIDE
jgi:hypothetical protein